MKKKTGKLLYCYIAILFLIFQLLIFAIPKVAIASANHLVISEVQISGATADDEFIELYNPSNLSADISNWSIQYRGGAATTYYQKSFTAGSIIPGFGFFLIANNVYDGGALVSADISHGSFSLSGTGGTVFLVNNQTLLTSTTDSGASVIDKVAYGSGANLIPETSAFTPAPASNGSIERNPGVTNSTKGNGEDSNINLNDFLTRVVSEPQNSSSPTETPADYVFPLNSAPSIEIGSNQTVFKDTEVSFSCPGCSDSDGFIMSYAWNFGDGSTSTETSPKHTYIASANFTVSLTITDDDGATSNDWLVISVVEMPTYSDKVLINEFMPSPGNVTDWDSSGVADSNDEWIELINLDDAQIDLGGWVLDDVESGGSVAYTIPVGTKIDPDGFKVFYKKDTSLTLNNTGDDVVLKDPNGIVVDQTSFDTGTTDKSFSRSANSATSSWVTNYAPSPGRLNLPPANISPFANAGSSITGAKTGEAVNFNGSASSDPDGSIASYEWNFGDGSIGNGVQASHTYSTAGSYQVTLTVRDNIGATNSASINVSVVQGTGTTPYQNQYSSDIKIISIMPNPDGTEPDMEFIKLFNSASKDINIRNWILDDEEGGSKPFTIDYDVNIKAGATISFYGSDTKISLNNDGDSARLYDPDKKLISSVIYTDKAGKGVPYVQEDGKWIWQIGATTKPDTPPTPKPTTPVLKPTETPAPNITAIIPKETNTPVTTPNVQIEPNAVNSTKTEISAYEPMIYAQEKPSAALSAKVGQLASNTQTQKTSSFPSADFTQSKQTKESYPKPYQNPYLVVPLMLIFCGTIFRFVIPSGFIKSSLSRFISSRQKEDDLADLFK